MPCSWHGLEAPACCSMAHAIQAALAPAINKLLMHDTADVRVLISQHHMPMLRLSQSVHAVERTYTHWRTASLAWHNRSLSQPQQPQIQLLLLLPWLAAGSAVGCEAGTRCKCPGSRRPLVAAGPRAATCEQAAAAAAGGTGPLC
jgi:hypothetical protein